MLTFGNKKMSKPTASQQRFLQFIDPRGTLDASEQEDLLKNSEIQTYRKNGHLVVTGDEVNHVLYLLDGIVRYYVLTHDGREVTKSFYKNSFLIGSFDVTFNNIASKFSVQALSDVRALKIPIANIRLLLENSHSFSKCYNQFLTSVFVFKEKREIELLSTTGKERYENFIKEFPELLGDLSGVALASYLGITPVQLSRIKSQG